MRGALGASVGRCGRAGANGLSAGASSAEANGLTAWPPDFGADYDCSVCVSAESHNSGALTIQHALDEVRTVGGKVCLGPGFYRLDRGLELSGARSVTLHGSGWRTVLSAPGTVAAISIENSVGVTVEDLTVITSSRGRTATATVGGTAVSLRNTAGVTIERCVLLQSGFIRSGATLLAADTIRLASPFVASKAGGGPAIGLDGFSLLTTIRENVVVATAGIGNLSSRPKLDLTAARAMDLLLPTARERAVRASYLLTGGLVIQDNFLRCDRTGVSLEWDAALSRFRDNDAANRLLHQEYRSGWTLDA